MRYLCNANTVLVPDPHLIINTDIDKHRYISRNMYNYLLLSLYLRHRRMTVISVRMTTTMRMIPPATEGRILFRRNKVAFSGVTASACVKKFIHTHTHTQHTQHTRVCTFMYINCVIFTAANYNHNSA